MRWLCRQIMPLSQILGTFVVGTPSPGNGEFQGEFGLQVCQEFRRLVARPDNHYVVYACHNPWCL